MRFTTWLENPKQIPFLENKVAEVIISPALLARLGKCSLNESYALADICRSKNIRTVLEWDILMTENVFNSLEGILRILKWNKFDAIRTQDPGALQFLLEKKIDIPLQLILETGNHNLEAMKEWCQLAGEKLERLILSQEIPKTELANFIAASPVPVEVLGLGRILLFYTPRSLVKPLFDSDEESIEVRANSEESPHKGFPVIENRHGTFMFNPKDSCLIEELPSLQEMGLEYLRLDFRSWNNYQLIGDIFELNRNFSKDKADDFKAAWPVQVIRGFFNVNKSDVLFKKLKNQKIQRQDEKYLGEVVDVKKKKYVGLMLKSERNFLSLGDQLEFHTPEGKLKRTSVNEIFDAGLNRIEKAHHGQIVFIPHVSGVSIRTAVYL